MAFSKHLHPYIPLQNLILSATGSWLLTHSQKLNVTQSSFNFYIQENKGDANDTLPIF